MQKIILALIFASLASTAHAQTCTFTSECFDTEECTETDYELTIAHDDHGAPILESIAENLHVTAIGGDGDTHTTFIASTNAATHLLTRTTDGSARYTVHMADGPLMLSYLGSCTAAED